VLRLGLLVIGQSFTLITGNFDLSSESTMGLTAMVAALLLASSKNGGLDLGVNPLLAIGAMLFVGVLIGWINGFLITKLKMNNFIVTVAMLMIIRGVIYAISPGKSASFLPEAFNWLGGGTLVRLIQSNGKPLVIPTAALFMILSFLIAHIVTRYRRFGRNMYARLQPGGCPPGSTRRIIMAVYIISGLCAAWPGCWMPAGWTAPPRTVWLIFPSRPAVIGGISLFGGAARRGRLRSVLLWASWTGSEHPRCSLLDRGGPRACCFRHAARRAQGALPANRDQKALVNNPIGLRHECRRRSCRRWRSDLRWILSPTGGRQGRLWTHKRKIIANEFHPQFFRRAGPTDVNLLFAPVQSRPGRKNGAGKTRWRSDGAPAGGQRTVRSMEPHSLP
jgi:ribose/xylose/arabinose/galactoside ABC-type transport system permease subunit